MSLPHYLVDNDGRVSDRVKKQTRGREYLKYIKIGRDSIYKGAGSTSKTGGGIVYKIE